MPEFEFDHNLQRATCTFRKGAQVARTATLNGNTARYDANGEIVDYIIANPFGSSGVDLNGLPQHDLCREMLRHFNLMRSSR